MDNKQKEQVKKWLIFSGLGLIFALSMWFIFAPSDKAKSVAEEGLNKDLPSASIEELTDNKLKAYELGASEAQAELERSEMGRLSDYFAEKTEAPTTEENEPNSKIEHSLHRYEENTRLINSFYAPDPRDEEREALRAEIDELRAALSARQDDEESEEERQLALMEKSYQMAAKYLPQGSAGGFPPNAYVEAKERPIAEPQTTATVNEPQMEVLVETKPVVSSLDQPMSDAEFIQAYGLSPRNLGFHSLKSKDSSAVRNSLRVVVDKTTTVQEGDYVVLRLLETAKVQGLRIPRQSRLIAQAKIAGNRMQLLIKSIEVDGHISPVKLSAYDTDGQEGVYIPGSENISALKEMGANIGGSMGTSFTFASSAKDQIISEAARGVMQGASQLLQKKLRTIKVTLKGGYKLFLVQTK